MSATYPASTELASIQFIGTGGADVTYQLIGGSDIRDYYQGSFVNTLNNTVSGVNALNAFTCNDPSNCLGGAGSGSNTGTGNVNTGLTGNYLIDEQDFELGSAFAGQTLTQIVITDTYNGSDRSYSEPRWAQSHSRLRQLQSPQACCCSHWVGGIRRHGAPQDRDAHLETDKLGSAAAVVRVPVAPNSR